MIIIDADCILANLLQSREVVTIYELNNIRNNIEQAIPRVYVDVTKNCIVWAANQYPNMFKLTDDGIYRCSSWSKNYAEEFFNWRIPVNVLELFKATCQ
jgi:hypothetical protein